MNPISAFWHRTRGVYVPLTADEWDRKSKIGISERIKLGNSGMVYGAQTSYGPVVYEITTAGIAAHKACKA